MQVHLLSGNHANAPLLKNVIMQDSLTPTWKHSELLHNAAESQLWPLIHWDLLHMTYTQFSCLKI